MCQNYILIVYFADLVKIPSYMQNRRYQFCLYCSLPQTEWQVSGWCQCLLTSRSGRWGHKRTEDRDPLHPDACCNARCLSSLPLSNSATVCSSPSWSPGSAPWTETQLVLYVFVESEQMLISKSVAVQLPNETIKLMNVLKLFSLSPKYISALNLVYWLS